ncbi:hypothetical protein UXB74_23405 [Escherichia marmotae]|nr:hypothetical protein [Escherichia marmotae]
MALVRPDGERLTCRYDKLTRLTEITNAEGECHRPHADLPLRCRRTLYSHQLPGWHSP